MPQFSPLPEVPHPAQAGLEGWCCPSVLTQLEARGLRNGPLPSSRSDQEPHSEPTQNPLRVPPWIFLILPESQRFPLCLMKLLMLWFKAMTAAELM